MYWSGLMRKLLFSRESEVLEPIRALVEQQNHRTLVLWVFDLAPLLLELFEKYFPYEKRPYEALETAKKWVRGELKMPVAKKSNPRRPQRGNGC